MYEKTLIDDDDHILLWTLLKSILFFNKKNHNFNMTLLRDQHFSNMWMCIKMKKATGNNSDVC